MGSESEWMVSAFLCWVSENEGTQVSVLQKKLVWKMKLSETWKGHVGSACWVQLSPRAHWPFLSKLVLSGLLSPAA